MFKRLSYIVLIVGVLISLNGCNSGNSTPPANTAISNVQFQVLGTQEINTSVGGSREVTLAISSKQNLSNFHFDNLDELAAANPDWQLVGEFKCVQLNPTNSCSLTLNHAPTQLKDKGVLTLNYSYSQQESNFKATTQSNIIASTTQQSGSTSVNYTATSANNVNATVTPSAAIKELVGLTQAVSINFAPDNTQSASNLQINSGLTSLSVKNPGWSGPSSFSCANFKTACTLNLVYQPTSAAQSGTLNLTYSYVNSAGVQTNATLAINYQALVWGSNYSTTTPQYITANSVAAQPSNMSGIYPAVPANLSTYLGTGSALGYLGPISSFGPLGALGPLGTNMWNPSAWISGSLSWNSYFPTINGPLSANGPLGQNGPYTESAYYSGTIFSNNSFDANTRAFGLWSILGPIGPLGAVGPLGPLGPIGATGLTSLPATGQFVNASSQVVRSVSVPYNATTSRSFDVYENYAQSYATQMPDNDTSFMVVGSLGLNSSNSYTINSSQNQIVTVLVVPNSTLMTNIMYVSLYNTTGKLIAQSNSNSYINYIEFTAPANASYVVKISQASTSLSSAYSLYVTGSYSYLNKYYIQGNYITN